MHISEGILSAPVLMSGAALAAAGTAIGLKKMDYDHLPQVAVLSAGFFVATLVHIPVGPASTHLILNGLMGVFLGWVAFPAILIGLILQALLFQYGGLTTLGVNCLNMAIPALICFYLFGSFIRTKKIFYSMTASFLCGFGAVFLGSLMLALNLVLTGEYFSAVAKLIVFAHFPVMVLEGFITVLCVKFFKRVKPELLEVIYAR